VAGSDAVGMAEKALENLEASTLLATNERWNATANRLHYASFQAAVHALEGQGKRPEQLSQYKEWKHKTICDNASLVRGRWDDRKLYMALRTQRVESDYTDRDVEVELVKSRLAEVDELVREATK